MKITCWHSKTPIFLEPSKMMLRSQACRAQFERVSCGIGFPCAACHRKIWLSSLTYCIIFLAAGWLQCQPLQETSSWLLPVASWCDQYHSISFHFFLICHLRIGGYFLRCQAAFTFGFLPTRWTRCICWCIHWSGPRGRSLPLGWLTGWAFHRKITWGTAWMAWQLRPCVGFTAGSHSIRVCWDALLFWYLGLRKCLCN